MNLLDFLLVSIISKIGKPIFEMMLSKRGTG